MKFIIINCKICGKECSKPIGAINRANKMKLNLYCDKKCAGIGRRITRTIDEKKKLKADYDKEYRILNLEKIKLRKKESHKKNYIPEIAREKRKLRMPYHVEYCRKPEYKAKKHQYDIKRNAKNSYGEFWESALIINEVKKLIDNKLNYEKTSK